MENSGLQIYGRIYVWVTYEFVIVCIPPNINAVPATSQLHVLQIERTSFRYSSINNRQTLSWGDGRVEFFLQFHKHYFCYCTNWYQRKIKQRTIYILVFTMRAFFSPAYNFTMRTIYSSTLVTIPLQLSPRRKLRYQSKTLWKRGQNAESNQ